MAVVSVLMTSYNREQYIGAAIESVLASTLSDFELIIVDDGSKDHTVEIARGYEKIDGRVKVYVNENNLGDYPNRNKAAEYSASKYIKYVDADDYIYPWGLKNLVEMMEAFPQAGWGLCSLEQDRSQPFPFPLQPEQAFLYHYEGPGLFHKAPLSAIIRRDAFQEVGGFRPIRMAGDFDMWNRLAKKWPVLLMPHGIVWYREHAEQEMKQHYKFIATYEKLKIEHLRDNMTPLSASARQRILEYEKYKNIKSLLKGLLTFNASLAGASWKRIMQYYV